MQTIPEVITAVNKITELPEAEDRAKVFYAEDGTAVVLTGFDVFEVYLDGSTVAVRGLQAQKPGWVALTDRVL